MWILAFGLGPYPVVSQEVKLGSIPASSPETIYCVSHVRRGHEAAYASLLAKAWAVYRRLDLVLPKPHLVVRGADDSGIPDNAPKEVRDVWKEMETTCEPRDGRPGMDISEGGVTLIESD
jgi:hypothetical protein